MLPDTITTETVRKASDALDLEDDSYLERVGDGMFDYADAIAQRIAAEHGLSDEQAEELSGRIVYRFELLPPDQGVV